ncbi:MAG: efflux RND transporter periplasmic adaptor subunit [Acidobacteriaceae bacterium]|nr:efflux RND transporter periplasmic adaptor subunit [Acidobacteriaceae bacterium]
MATINEPLKAEEDLRQNDPYGGRRQRPGHSVRYWLLFAVALIFAAAAVYFFGWLPRYQRQQEINREAQQRTDERPRVEVQTVRRAQATSELMVPGTTLAFTEAYIYARASGYVSKRLADIGDHVRQGQLLAVIDAPDLDKQVAQARSNLEQSQSNLTQVEAQLHLAAVTWDRWKVLVARGVFSRQEGDQQEANYRVAEANVRAAQNTIQANRENLDRLLVLQGYERVTAPFSGVVTARNIDVGALINAGGSGLGSSTPSSNPGPTTAAAQGNNQGASGNLASNVNPSTGGASGGEMFSIANVDRLRVLVSVPEAYTSVIHVGQRAALFFQERPNDKIEGRVTRTSASIDQNTRTLLVEVQVANDRRLVPGMYVVVNFINVKGEPPLIIPGAAIVVRNGKTVVAVVEGQTVHLRPIGIGRDYGDQTEITSGLKEGDAIVTNVTDEIRDGIEVDPQFPKNNQAPGAGGQSDKNPGNQGQYGQQGLTNSAQKASGSGQGKGKSGAQGGSKSAGSGKQ